MIVLIVGVLIGGWTSVVVADTSVWTTPQQDSYTVTASVPAPAPTQAATVDSPTNGKHFSDKPIVVSGSCPYTNEGDYVSIYRNNFYSGTALCSSAGQYQLSIDLFTGANQLIARVYNFTDVPGPDSDPVTVYYDPPAQPVIPVESSTSTSTKSARQGFAVSSSPSSGTSVSVVPLTLSSDFKIRGYYVGEQTVWQLDLEGGTAPYALAIDWGDGSTGVVSRGTAGVARLTHTYEKSGKQQGSYTVKFTVTDTDGAQSFLQEIVVVNSRKASTLAAGRTGGTAGFSSGVLHMLSHFIWPSYAVVVLMLISFWLGERREYNFLKPRLRKVRHA